MLVSVTVRNSGDEPARNVEVSLFLPEGFVSEPAYFNDIPSNTSVSANFNISIPPSSFSGKYFASLVTKYEDANNYPFSAVSPLDLFVSKRTESDLRVYFDSEATVDPKGSGRMTAVIDNSGNLLLNVSLGLVTPRELFVDNFPSIVEIPGKSSKKITFSISSRGALSGSVYVIILGASYRSGGAAYAASSTPPGIVRIVKQDSSNYYLILAGFLVVFGIAFVVWKLFFSKKQA